MSIRLCYGKINISRVPTICADAIAGVVVGPIAGLFVGFFVKSSVGEWLGNKLGYALSSERHVLVRTSKKVYINTYHLNR